MGSNLEIRVLGDLQVLRGGEVVELPPSRKTRALLAYLAVVARPQRRERLCEMLWEVPDDPRGALRWSLSKIRGIVNDGERDHLTSDRNTVELNTRVIRTDFHAVQALTLKGLDDLDVATLRTLADGFRGFFLDDLSLPRCSDYEAWRTAQANDMELLRLGLLRRLLDRLDGEPGVALPYAHQLQRLVPDDPGLPKLVASLAEAARRRSIERVGKPVEDTAAEARSPEPETAAVAAEVRFCTARDGVRIAYSVTGSGPVIVRAAHWMSHLKYDMESPVWRHWMRELSARNTLVRYDERGNGLSAWDVDDFGFEAMVADLESIIDASGQQKVVLLGVSQSCAMSVAYAVRHPERVLGLVLYGGYVKGWRARGQPSEIALRQAMNTLMREGWGKDDPVFRQLFTSLFIPGASRDQMEWFNELQRRSVTPENAYRLAEAFGDIDVTHLLPRVGVPTLVIHARGDRVAPIESGKAFAAGIRGARFVELESGNHILLEDEPAFEEFIGEVRRFVAEVTAPRPAAATVGANTKRPLTVLVVDIAGDQDAFDLVDPELAARLVDPIVSEVEAIVARHGGHVVDVREGVVTTAFGADRAFEQHAVQACRAARAIRDAMTRSGTERVKVRIGIDSGEAIVRTADPVAGGRVSLSGPVLKSAARVATSVRRETVVLTARARESAGGFVSAVPLSRFECPGLSDDEHVFELLAENKALSRWHLRARQGLTSLIGRSREIDALSMSWLEAREGRGRIVGVVGSPGVGKSRITHEFVGSDELRGFTLVEAGAQEIEGSASFSLAKRIMLSFLGLEEDEDEETVARTVRRRFTALDTAHVHLTPILYLLDQPVSDSEWQATNGLDRAKRIRDAFTTLLCRETETRPFAILVEDLHWADLESCKALAQLAGAVTDRRILLIMTYRPGFQPPWADAPGAREIYLGPLGTEESLDLVAAILGDDPSLADLTALICERADGIPLFVEEIIGALVQNRHLEGAPGRMQVLRPTDRLEIPASVQSVIAARVDKLDAVDRTLLQIASVIGAVASHRLLYELSGLGEVFQASMDRLKATELMFEGRGGSEAEYHFKHALIQQATYRSLPEKRRRDLHAQTLAVLERLQVGRAGDQVERLAHHALRAELWEKAALHLVSAADRAIERSAFRTAGEFLEQAVGALGELPETAEHQTMAIDIRTRMRIVYMVTGDFEKAISRLNEALDIARRTNDIARLAYALLHTSYCYSTYGRVEEALAVADEARAIGLLIGDDRQVAEADVATAQAYMIRGGAAASLTRLVPHAEDFRSRWADDRMGFLVTRSVWFLGSIASTRALLGERERADADIAEAVRLADASGRPIDRYAAAYFESLVRIVHGPDEAYLHKLAAVVVESRDSEPFPFHPWLSATLGHAAYVAGRPTEATTALETALEAAEQANMPHFVVYTAAILAVVAAQPGDLATLEDLADALRSARACADPWIEIEVLRAMGRIHGGETARSHLEAARMIAEAAGYRPFVDAIQAELQAIPAAVVARLSAG